MSNFLGSYISILDNRLGVGNNDFPEADPGTRFLTGYLIDESDNIFVDESGNKLVYVSRSSKHALPTS